MFMLPLPRTSLPLLVLQSSSGFALAVVAVVVGSSIAAAAAAAAVAADWHLLVARAGQPLYSPLTRSASFSPFRSLYSLSQQASANEMRTNERKD